MDKRNNRRNNVTPVRSDLIVLIVLSIVIAVLLVGFAVSSKISSPREDPLPETGPASGDVPSSATVNTDTSTSATAQSETLSGETSSPSSGVPSSDTVYSAEQSTTEATAQTTANKTTATSKAVTTTTSKTTTTTKKQTTTTTKAETSDPSKLSGLSISCDYFIGYDKTNNKVLYEKNADAKCYPASVTKMLTALVALENMPVDAKVTVGKEIKMIASDSSKAGIKVGQIFTLRGILYGLMLPSGNDAAYTIAVNVARYLYGKNLSDEDAVSRFMDLCNNRLKKLGAKNTHFSCPDGYHHDDHYTTVRDMLKIAVYAMENPVFAEIVGSTYKEVYTEDKELMKFYNSNRMINGGYSDYYKYCTGIKTGLTDEAKYCLAASAKKDGRELYAIAFHGSSASRRNSDVKHFFEAAFAK